MEPEYGAVRACDSVRLLREQTTYAIKAGEVGIAHSFENGLWCVDFRRYRTAWISAADLIVVSR